MTRYKDKELKKIEKNLIHKNREMIADLEKRIEELGPKIKRISYEGSSSEAQYFIDELYGIISLQNNLIKFMYHNTIYKKYLLKILK